MTFDAILHRFEGEPGVERGTNWRSDGLRINGKIFAMEADGDLVVKLPAARCAELVDAGQARPFEAGGRKMREWVRVGADRGDDWVSLADEAFAFVG
jgi:hypothetical protein